MPKINPESLDRLEASEARQRKQTSQSRAIRRGLHRARFAPQPVLCTKVNQEGGDCQEVAVVQMLPEGDIGLCATHLRKAMSVWDVDDLRAKLTGGVA